jgi:CRP-like cAMP-binding protein
MPGAGPESMLNIDKPPTDSYTSGRMANPLQLSIVNFQRNSYIIVEGKQDAVCFFIIRSGKVGVSKEVSIVEEEGGSILGPGDFFGVVSTMSTHSHIETAQALTDVSLIAVRHDQYGMLIEKNAPVAMKIIQGFSKRMRYLDEAVTRLTFKSTGTEHPSHLFKVAEYYARQGQYNLAYYAYYRYLQHCPQGENVNIAKERMSKIHPYAKAVYLEKNSKDISRFYPKNTMICSEAEPGDELYIIQKGSIRVSKIVDDKEVLLALLKPGDTFGEMALLENKPRSASGIANEDLRVMVVNRANFQRMVQTQPQIITRLTKLLAERIWMVYRQLANAIMPEPLGRLYDRLYLELEKNRVKVAPGAAHSFDFGPKDLINMVGMSMEEGKVVLAKLFENKKIRVKDNRIETTDNDEIRKQVEYFKRMEKIQKSRQEGSLRSR